MNRTSLLIVSHDMSVENNFSKSTFRPDPPLIHVKNTQDQIFGTKEVDSCQNTTPFLSEEGSISDVKSNLFELPLEKPKHNTLPFRRSNLTNRSKISSQVTQRVKSETPSMLQT
jgi:hypothetical protein